mmetsp:Transcript_3844/g.10945  ORF Transcript_3844/g.10945 Transcript_3844/m.10945 type:complete len:202 (+) Transcript_3844:1069-1674(+)
MCCVVLDRDRTTTGTPSSMLRMILRHKSRKLVKLLTQPTKAGSRPMVTFPARSSSSKASFNCLSTRSAWTLSSISVMPSCLWKSNAWFATSSAAKGPLKKASSILRTLDRKSTSNALKDRAWEISASTVAGAARTWRPFSLPKASTVATTSSPGALQPRPRRRVFMGASCHALGSKASMRRTTSARSAFVSMPGVGRMSAE